MLCIQRSRTSFGWLAVADRGLPGASLQPACHARVAADRNQVAEHSMQRSVASAFRSATALHCMPSPVPATARGPLPT